MNVRRFFAPDLRRAIQLVRNEHGADAVILSSRAVDGGMEIVSARDYDQDLLAQMMGSAPPVDAGAPAPAPQAVAPEPAPQSAPTLDRRQSPTAIVAPQTPAAVRIADLAGAAAAIRDDETLDTISTELKAMKTLLCQQLAQLQPADARASEPERVLLARRVASLGLEPELADKLVGEVKRPGSDRAWREVMFGIARRLQVAKCDPLDQGGVFALVGPTGAGKTTTVAKLAARHCLRDGPESLALISTDTVRVGAQRQLEAFGAILGVPVRRAANRRELDRLLRDLRDRRLVLIDTAGMAPRDRRLAASLSELDVDAPVRRFMVLPANGQAAFMDDVVRRFGAGGVAGCVITKLDEAVGLGTVISVLIAHELAAVWLSHGQRVPEDLRIARVTHLLGWALEEGRQEPSEPQPRASRRAVATAEERKHVAV